MVRRRRCVMATALNVAEWMDQTLAQAGELIQADAVAAIKERFGSEFVYRNDSGGLSIQRAVLLEFRRLTKDTAVWVGEDKLWRHCLPVDDETRSAVAIRRKRYQCSRCGRPLARSQSSWRTVQLGDEHTGDNRRDVRLCHPCAEEVDALQESTPPEYIGYGGYWVFEESLRLRDEHVPNVEFIVIAPVTRQEVDRCRSLQ